MQKEIKIALLGSTGSIGKNTLEVVRNLKKNAFPVSVKYLSGNSNYEVLYKQILEFEPESAIIMSQTGYDVLKERLKDHKTAVLLGEKELLDIARYGSYNLLINAMVGFSGLKPTIQAIKKGINVALANKESLVIAGELITKMCMDTGSHIIPIDSEHSAILQCIQGEQFKSISRIVLTASGGPFLNTPKEDFCKLTVDEALKHPVWKMGNKITIDSASLMNKGFEIIEGKWLFNIDVDKIDVVIHPQSVIHSLVEFIDSSVKAQLGIPDMKIPIQYAITFPERLNSDYSKLSLSEIKCLTFAEPDPEKFDCLKIAYEVSKKGGLYPAVMNAANEVAVELFLNKEIKFSDIPAVIRTSLDHHKQGKAENINDFIEADRSTREYLKTAAVRVS